MYSYIVHINGSLLDLTCVHVFSRSCSSRPGQLGMALGKASHSARFARLRGKRVLVIRSFGVWLFSNCICGEYLQISTTARNLFSFCFGRKEPMRRGPLNQRFKAFFDFTAFYKSQLDLFAPCRKSAGAVFSKKKILKHCISFYCENSQISTMVWSPFFFLSVAKRPCVVDP